MKTNVAPENFWHSDIPQAIIALDSSLEGLTDIKAAERLKIYGSNAIGKRGDTSHLFLFFSQLKSPVTILLMVSALLSMYLGDKEDSLIILVIVLISSILSYRQEKGAADAVQALLKLVQLNGLALRNKEPKIIPVQNIVPGDIVILSAGDIIPADCLIINSNSLFVDEAAFTGESYPVEKIAGILPDQTPLAKRTNMLFMGAHVISGKATALVCSTGNQTEFGRISVKLKSKPPESDFERGLRKFGYFLLELTLMLIIIIFAINVLLHKPVLNSLLFSLALAVGLTPQLLPAVVSVNLATGARRMAALQVIVKRLSSIENLGSLNVLCTDKTGTITEGQVRLRDTLNAEGRSSKKVLQLAWLNATLQQGFKNPIDEAIRSAVESGYPGYAAFSEIPYDFNRKRLTVLVRGGEEMLAVTKGALNGILEICDRYESDSGDISDMAGKKAGIIALFEKLSGQGFRTLGVAYKPLVSGEDFLKEDEREMIFAGFVTLLDPIKPDVPVTVDKLRTLGIKLKIITGDNSSVARTIAIQAGIADPGVLTGPEIRQMSSSALIQQAPLTDVFAEVEPNQKEQLIWALKKGGYVVGFMGDGINDAPALHAADVGISVNTAVDVAKEAADLVLLGQDLNVLIDGIMEGRKTFSNTIKYIFMATSANFGNMFSMAGASLFLPFLPLLPKQILLTNLLTDFPEMTIGTDIVDAQSISSPQRWDLAFIRRFMITFGLLSSAFDLITFGILTYVFHANEVLFQSGWFLESIVSGILIVMVVRTRLPVFKSLPGKYLTLVSIVVLVLVITMPLTPISAWFGFSSLPAKFYVWILLIVSIYVFIAERVKLAFYKWMAKQGK